MGSARHRFKIAVIGDVHGNLVLLNDVLCAIDDEVVDAILFVGDIGPNLLRRGHRDDHNGRYTAVAQIVLEQAWKVCPQVGFVPGNHDDPNLRCPGAVNLDRQQITFAPPMRPTPSIRRYGEATETPYGGFTVYGVGGAPDEHFGWPYEWSSKTEAGTHADFAFYRDSDVILSHAPPRSTELDLLPNETHQGSAFLRELVEKSGKGFFACGHFHESAGAMALIGDRLCVNAGALGPPAARPQYAMLVRDEGGDTVVHVDLASGNRKELSREETKSKHEENMKVTS